MAIGLYWGSVCIPLFPTNMPSRSLWLTKGSQFWHYAKYISTEATITQSCLQKCFVTLCSIWGLETIQNWKMYQYNPCKSGKELVFLGVPVTEGMVLGRKPDISYLVYMKMWEVDFDGYKKKYFEWRNMIRNWQSHLTRQQSQWINSISLNHEDKFILVITSATEELKC